MGGIFDALSKAMTIFPTVKLSCLPRMADFARWGYAIAEALGVKGRDFLAAYQKNISLQNDEIIQGNTLAQAILSFMSDKEEWRGTIKEAWMALRDNNNPENSDSTFPKADRALRKHLERIKSNLLDHGISYEIGARGEKGYPITFQKNPNIDSAGSGSANQLSANQIIPEDKMNKIDDCELGSGLASADKCLSDNKDESPVANESNLIGSWNNLKEGVV
jgi:hypothetical protein